MLLLFCTQTALAWQCFWLSALLSPLPALETVSTDCCQGCGHLLQFRAGHRSYRRCPQCGLLTLPASARRTNRPCRPQGDRRRGCS